jgi:hypothetical protein
MVYCLMIDGVILITILYEDLHASLRAPRAYLSTYLLERKMSSTKDMEKTK